MPHLPNMLDIPSIWNSLVINRRKPVTYRLFTQSPIDKSQRICLHKFDPCHAHEAFFHPHPWPGAFLILRGSYWMEVGRSKDRLSRPDHVMGMELHDGSIYEIIHPYTWHSVIPRERTYTIMVNGEPWNKDTTHAEVRTTKGKDLDELTEEEKEIYLHTFRVYIADWLKKEGY
jgi:hypothetical protein